MHPMARRFLIIALALALCLGTACTPQNAGNPTAARQAETCLPGERGYLRASLRGAIEAELDWRGAALQCEGGARPDGRGLRVSFLGPADTQGHRLRVVFGIAALPGDRSSAAAATNLTVIAEGQNRIYATQGEGKCAVESLVQEPLAPATGAKVSAAGARHLYIYRVAARGYCIDPAATLDGSGRLYVNRFDFAGIARFEDNDLHASALHT